MLNFARASQFAPMSRNYRDELHVKTVKMEGILLGTPDKKVKNEISSENPRGSAPQSVENVEIRVEKSEKWIVTARPIEGCSDFDFWNSAGRERSGRILEV